jgi:pilus assembly protein CpaB
VAILLYVVLRKQVGPPEPTEPTTVAVVVAKSNIPALTPITEGMVEVKQVAREDAPRNALSNVDQAVGRISQYDLTKNQPLTRTDVAPRTALQGLTFVIPEGMRAVTVALDPISGVGGFVFPNDRVDVLATFEQAEMVVTKTILQDVEVLAMNEQTVRPAVQKPAPTDEDAQPSEKAPAATQVKSATLVVTPHQTQILILSASKGSIHLVLRPREDRAQIALETSNYWALIGVPPPAPKEAPEEEPSVTEAEKEEREKEEAKAPPRPPLPTVTVIRGGQREVVELEGG